MKKNTIILIVLILLIVIGFVAYSHFETAQAPTTITPVTTEPVTTTDPNSSVVYDNSTYGFTFSLPDNWKGYSIVKETWTGNSLTDGKVNQTGPKILIRNPKWTTTTHYEDIPLMVFTLAQWNSYSKGDYAVSAAPFNAAEIGRNNSYVFALPPRWDYDYSTDYQEADNIIAGKPLHPYNLK